MHHAGGERIQRLKPRYNEKVNQWWMCDEGRYGYKFIDENRLTHVQFRHNGSVHQKPWEEGLEAIAETLKRLRDTKSLDQVGVILSSHMTNENLYATKKFFTTLGVKHLVFQRPKSGSSDAFLIQADKSPNAKGAQALSITEGAQALLDQTAKKTLRVLFVFVQDLVELFGQSNVQQAAQQLELLVFVGTNRNPTADLAHVALPSAVYAEQDGTFTNFEGRVQRLNAAFTPWGEAKPEWQIVSELSEKLRLGVAFVDPQTIFAELAKSEKPFLGLTYEQIGDQGAMLKA